MAEVQNIINYPLIELGDTHLTLNSIVKLLLVMALVVLVERYLRRIIRRRVLARTHLEPDLQFAISRFVGYCFIAVGFFFAFRVMNLDLSSLAVIVGGLGIGIGFGLQNIVSNCICAPAKSRSSRRAAAGSRRACSRIDGWTSRSLRPGRLQLSQVCWPGFMISNRLCGRQIPDQAGPIELGADLGQALRMMFLDVGDEFFADVAPQVPALGRIRRGGQHVRLGIDYARVEIVAGLDVILGQHGLLAQVTEPNTGWRTPGPKSCSIAFDNNAVTSAVSDFGATGEVMETIAGGGRFWDVRGRWMIEPAGPMPGRTRHRRNI